MTDDDVTPMVRLPISMLVDMPQGHQIVAITILSADPEGEVHPQFQNACYRAQVPEPVYTKLYVAEHLRRMADELELAHMAEGGAPDDTGTGYRVARPDGD